MLFSSITFLYSFLPAVLILYFLVPRRLKNTVIFLASVFFYWWGEPKYLVLMSAAVVQGYLSGILIEKFRKDGKAAFATAVLAVSVVLSLGMLGLFKYTDFFIRNFNALTGLDAKLLHIALPIGISFYTFQILSYTVDVYRGSTAAQKNPIDFAAYVAMFPQLIAGPIVRYSDIAPELRERTHSLSGTALGMRRFVFGLSKKVLIANVLGELADAFRSTEEPTVLFVWLYAIACTLHIYFDFSGYSDMAIGLGKIFGFTFPENFNYPYISASITEFWRRWHMSLGTWFRDYLYIPLGGNRVSRPRWMWNLLVVWMATGLWHGASWNFVVWGLLFAVLLMAEKLVLLQYLRKSRVLSHIYVLFFILLSFVIFDHTNMTEGLTVIGQMLGTGNIPLVNAESLYYLRSYLPMLLLSVLGATPLPVMAVRRLSGTRAGYAVTSIAEPFLLLCLMTMVTAFLIDGSFNPFLYFRF